MEYVVGYMNFLWSAVEFLFYFWPVTLMLLLNLGLSVIYAKQKDRRTFSLNQLSLLIWPLVTVLLGGIFRYDGPHSDAPLVPYVLVNSLLVVQFVHLIAIVWWNRGYRWVTGSVGLILVWYGMFCTLLATMMVTNLWL